MLEYEKQLRNGLWVAKRGYCYFLYTSLEAIKRDDEEVSHNLERINKGTDVFNRCYDGSWIFYSRKMAEVKSMAKEMYLAKEAKSVYESKPIKADFFETTTSFSGHSNNPFAHKTFFTIKEMLRYARKFNRDVYIRFEDWTNGPTSMYQEMFMHTPT